MAETYATPTDALCSVLWHYRHTAPSLSVKVPHAERAGMAESLAYTKQEATIKVVEGADYDIIVMVDQQGNAIVPVENNEADHAKGERTRKVEAIRDSVPYLVQRIRSQIATGDFSNSELEELCNATLALAGK